MHVLLLSIKRRLIEAALSFLIATIMAIFFYFQNQGRLAQKAGTLNFMSFKYNKEGSNQSIVAVTTFPESDYILIILDRSCHEYYSKS